MSEWLLQLKIKNNLLLEKIKSAGYASLKSFCTDNNIEYNSLIALINFRISPLYGNGQLRGITSNLLDYFKCTVNDLFTPEQIGFNLLHTPEATLTTDELYKSFYLKKETIPELEYECKQRKDILLSLMEKLPTREREIIKMVHLEEKTYKDCGKYFGLSGTRVREIEKRAIRRLKSTYENEYNT